MVLLLLYQSIEKQPSHVILLINACQSTRSYDNQYKYRVLQPSNAPKPSCILYLILRNQTFLLCSMLALLLSKSLLSSKCIPVLSVDFTLSTVQTLQSLLEVILPSFLLLSPMSSILFVWAKLTMQFRSPKFFKMSSTSPSLSRLFIITWNQLVSRL